MTDKTLKDKAINIKGKSYVLVSDRIIYFNENYKNGSIKTKLISTPDAEVVVVKAQVTPNIDFKSRFFTGHSQAKWGEGMVNKTAALENCETSAVGRALAMMGIGVIDSVASVDEIKKATYPVTRKIEDATNDPIMESTKGMGIDKPASEGQRKMIFAVANQKGLTTEKAKKVVKSYFKLNSFNDLTMSQAKKTIDNLLKKPSIVEVDSDQIQA